MASTESLDGLFVLLDANLEHEIERLGRKRKKALVHQHLNTLVACRCDLRDIINALGHGKTSRTSANASSALSALRIVLEASLLINEQNTNQVSSRSCPKLGFLQSQLHANGHDGFKSIPPKRIQKLSRTFRVRKQYTRKLGRCLHQYLLELREDSPAATPVDALVSDSKIGLPVDFVSLEYSKFAEHLYDALALCQSLAEAESGGNRRSHHSLQLGLFRAQRHGQRDDEPAVNLTVQDHVCKWKTVCHFRNIPHTCDKLARLENLCHIRESELSAIDSIELLLRDGQLWLGHGESEWKLNLTIEQGQCLFDYLDKGKYEMDITAKRLLMLIIAKSILPLIGSKWVPSTWSRKHIILFAGQQDGFPDVSRPFLDIVPTASIVDSELDHGSDNEFDQLLRGPHPLLRELGILFVEIEKGATVASIPGNPMSISGETMSQREFEYRKAEHEYRSNLRSTIYADMQRVMEICLYPLDSSESLSNSDLSEVEKLRSTAGAEIVKLLDAHWNNCCEPQTSGGDLDKRFQWDAKRFLHPRRKNQYSAVLPNDGGQSKSIQTMDHTAITEHHGPLLNQQPYPGKFWSNHVSTAVNAVLNRTEVADWFTRYDKFVKARLVRKPEQKFMPRARIAVIDSYVNDDHEAMPRERLKSTVCYDDLPLSREDRNERQWAHGTHVVNLLSRTAPFADIYVAEAGPADQDLLDEPLEKAILAAEQADIIVMAFGWIPHQKPGQSKYPRFERVMKKMALPSHKRLLFAAASNGGAPGGRSYPAKQNHVFAIHACDHWGNSSGFNPTYYKSETNYITIGHEVEGYNSQTRESGTSFATPIAAGIAWAVIEMMRLHAHLIEEDGWDDSWMDYIQTYDGMKKVLDAMSKRRGDYDYLEWETWFATQRDNKTVCNQIFEALQGHKLRND